MKKSNEKEELEITDEILNEEDKKIELLIKIGAVAIVIAIVALGGLMLFNHFHQPFASATNSNHVHTYAKEYTVDIEPTCSQEGVESRHCTVQGCTSKTDERKIAKTEHDFDDGVTTNNQITQKAEKIYTCKNCGYRKTEEINEEHTHVWGEPVVVKQATCQEEGLKKYKCVNCDETKEETIPIGEHVYALTMSQVECGKEGKNTYKCTLCGKEKQEKTEVKQHEFIEEKTPSTCTTPGTYIKKCKNCGYVAETKTLELTQHDFTNMTVLQEGNCQTERIVQYTCKYCGAKKQEIEPATNNHNFQTVTRTENGVTIQEEKCTVCGITRAQTPVNNQTNTQTDNATTDSNIIVIGN